MRRSLIVTSVTSLSESLSLPIPFHYENHPTGESNSTKRKGIDTVLFVDRRLYALLLLQYYTYCF